jgi:hypothetical protein
MPKVVNKPKVVVNKHKRQNKKTRGGGGYEIKELRYRLGVHLEKLHGKSLEQHLEECDEIIGTLKLTDTESLLEITSLKTLETKIPVGSIRIYNAISKFKDEIREESFTEMFKNKLEELRNETPRMVMSDKTFEENTEQIRKSLKLTNIYDLIIDVEMDDIIGLKRKFPAGYIISLMRLRKDLEKKYKVSLLLMKTKLLTFYEAKNVVNSLEISDPINFLHFSEEDINNIDTKILSEKKKKQLWRWILWYILNTELNKIYDNDTTKKIIKGVEEYSSENTSFTVDRVYNLFSESVLKDEVENMMMEKKKKRTLGDDEPPNDVEFIVEEVLQKALQIINVLEFINLDSDNLERIQIEPDILQLIKDLKDAFETKYIDILYIITKAQSNYRQFLILEDEIKQLFIPIIRKRMIYRLQLKSVDDLIKTSDDLITKKFPDDEKNRQGGRRNASIIFEQRNRLIRLRDRLKEIKEIKEEKEKLIDYLNNAFTGDGINTNYNAPYITYIIQTLRFNNIYDLIDATPKDINDISEQELPQIYKVKLLALRKSLKTTYKLYTFLMKNKNLTQHEAIYVYKTLGILNPDDLVGFSKRDIDSITKLTNEKKGKLWNLIEDLQSGKKKISPSSN